MRTIRQRLAAAPLSGPWTANAPVAVEPFSMVSSLPLLTLRIFAVGGHAAEAIDEHAAIYRAIRGGDSEAAAAHLDNTLEDYRREIQRRVFG